MPTDVWVNNQAKVFPVITEKAKMTKNVKVGTEAIHWDEVIKRNGNLPFALK